MRRSLAFLAAIASPLILSAVFDGTPLIPSAHAQMITSREGIALEDQILSLKQQIQALQQGGNGGSALGQSQPGAPQQSGNGGSSQMVAKLLQQVQSLQGQVQSLHGELDQLRHKEQVDHDQLDKKIGDLKFQLQQSGALKSDGTSGSGTSGSGASNGGANAAAGGKAASPAPGRQKGGTLGTLPAGKSHSEATHDSSGHKAEHKTAQHASSAPHVEASLSAARHALATHDLKTAEADANAVIAKHGKGAYHGAAELVRAEALARQGRHREAAIAYDDAYSADKNGPHAPEALLGLASSLAAIHQTEAACDTLKSLTSQFPNPPASIAKGVQTTRARAHCH